MRTSDALVNVSRLFLDTAPVIYFVERNPQFVDLVDPVFERLSADICPLTSDEISALLASLMSVTQWVYIYYLWRPNLKDEADNHLIELAVAGNAQIIATHNVKDFQNAELLFPNLSILKPEELIRS